MKKNNKSLQNSKTKKTTTEKKKIFPLNQRTIESRTKCILSSWKVFIRTADLFDFFNVLCRSMKHFHFLFPFSENGENSDKSSTCQMRFEARENTMNRKHHQKIFFFCFLSMKIIRDKFYRPKNIQKNMQIIFERIEYCELRIAFNCFDSPLISDARVHRLTRNIFLFGE